MDDSRLTELILDMNDFPVPQYYSEEDEEYAVETVDGTLVLASDFDFRLVELLLDMNGFPIPQLWDPIAQEFVPRTTQGGGSGGGGDYTLPIATTTVLGGVKPDGTTVEVDANGVLSIKDGAIAPIQSLVRSVNLILPDPITGDVELPPIPPQEYRYVEPLPPTEPESEYEMGTTAFITYFERATMEEWADIFDNPNVPDGDMMVVTHKYNNGVMHCIQMVDTFRDGEFKAQFSRQWDYTEEEWTPLNDISYVQSVNGIKPNVSGDVVIPNASETVRGLIRVINSSSAMIPGSALDAVQGTYLLNDIDVLRMSFNDHVELKSSNSTLGHVKVDGDTITIDSNGVISAVGGGSGSKWFVSETEPVGGTTSDFWLNSINHFVYTFDGTNWTQTNTNLRGATWFKGSENPPYSLGHIADFYLNTTTYDIFQKHILSWTLIGNIKGADGDPLQIVDSFDVYDSDKALSVNMGSELNDLVQNLYSSLIAHMDLKASSTNLGHVKVDGSTISIDANGVISANSASGFKIDNNILPSQAPSTYSAGVTVSYIPVGHANNADWLSFYGTYYANSSVASTFKMNFVVTTVKDATDKTTQTIKMYGNVPRTNFELTTATRTSNDDADTWMTPLATMPIYRNSGTPSAWKSALAGTLYYDHSGKGWFYKKFDGDNDISSVDWAPLVPTVLNVTDSPIPTPGEDFVYSAESVKEMVDAHDNQKASTTVYGHVKVDGTTITSNDGTISVPTASLTSRGVVQLYNSITSDSTVAATPSAVNSAIIAHAGITASTTVLGHVKVDGVTIGVNDGTISVPTANLTSRGVVQLSNSITSNSTVAATPNAVNNAIIAHSGVMASTTVLGHVKVDGTSIVIDANGVISSTPTAIPDATPTVKGITKLYTGVNNATDGAVTPLAVQGAINAHVSQRASTSIWGHVRVDGTSILSDNGTISFNKNNFVIVPYRWEFDVSANGNNIPVGTSSLTVEQLYAQANVYDEGVLMSKSAYNFTKTGDLFVLNFTNAVDRARKIFVIINQIQSV